MFPVFSDQEKGLKIHLDLKDELQEPTSSICRKAVTLAEFGGGLSNQVLKFVCNQFDTYFCLVLPIMMGAILPIIEIKRKPSSHDGTQQPFI
jgi:hypothetical protein